MTELLEALMNAKTKEEKERAYRNCEKMGMDRMTADLLVAELKNDRVIISVVR